MKFSAILERFEEVSGEPDGGYLARCPAHADSRPSLRVWLGDDGKVRLTCRAGCPTADVLKAVGLEWHHLFDVAADGRTVPRERPTMVGAEHLADLSAYLTAAAKDITPDAESYLLRRFGVTRDEAQRLGIGFDDDPEHLAGFSARSPAFLRYPRIVVPLYGFDGTARGAQGRDITGACPLRWVSLKNPAGHHWAKYGVFRGEGGYDAVVITEGPGDGLTTVAVGYDVVVIRGAALASNPELVEGLAHGLRGKLVLAAGDNDSAGSGFNSTLARLFAPYGIDVHALAIGAGAGDISEWRESDPESFPRAFHSAVKAARPILAGEVLREREQGDGTSANARDEAAGLARTDAESVRAVALVEDLTERFGASDVLNAHALVAFSGDRIRYADGLGWYVWNGVIWQRGERYVRQIAHDLGGALSVAADEEEDEDRAGWLKAIARGFLMKRRIDDLLSELSAVPSVWVPTAAFDAQHHLLSFRNGTVDLRSGEIRPHDKANLITYVIDLDYVPDAKAPRWEQFLAEIFPHHPELPAYVQRLVGYGITGSVDEQCFAVLWGKGSNGKSILTDTLTSVFEPITETTGFATFEEKKGGGIPNDIAALRNARLVMASEGEAGASMSESVLKRASGKDRMVARFMRQEFFTFKPTFLIMLATNYKPSFRGQDEGLWRRVKLIPFLRYFAPAERDYHLDARLMAEAEGIAAWAVRGAIEWYANGLADPAVITEATREYRETSDALAGFFPGVLERAEGATLSGAEAYVAYTDWCEAEGLRGRGDVWTRKALYAALEERELTKIKRNTGIVFVGCRLAADPNTPAGPGIFQKD